MSKTALAPSFRNWQKYPFTWKPFIKHGSDGTPQYGTASTIYCLRIGRTEATRYVRGIELKCPDTLYIENESVKEQDTLTAEKEWMVLRVYKYFDRKTAEYDFSEVLL